MDAIVKAVNKGVAELPKEVVRVTIFLYCDMLSMTKLTLGL